MTNVRGLWEFEGKEPPPHIKIEPLFIAYEWDTEAQAKKAWEKGWDAGTHVSIWRMMRPDGTRHQVICMGEKSKNVQRVEDVFVKLGGRSWNPEVGMMRALALRRYGTAVTEAAKGDGGETTIVNRWGQQGGMRLDTEGKMTPYKKEGK